MKNRRYEERRPGGGGATNLNFTSDSTALEAIIATHWGLLSDVHSHGYALGLEHGEARAEERAAARHHALMRHLAPILRAPEVDRDEAAARRARIDQRFGGERG